MKKRKKTNTEKKRQKRKGGRKRYEGRQKGRERWADKAKVTERQKTPCKRLRPISRFFDVSTLIISREVYNV